MRTDFEQSALFDRRRLSGRHGRRSESLVELHIVQSALPDAPDRASFPRLAPETRGTRVASRLALLDWRS